MTLHQLVGLIHTLTRQKLKSLQYLRAMLYLVRHAQTTRQLLNVVQLEDQEVIHMKAA